MRRIAAWIGSRVVARIGACVGAFGSPNSRSAAARTPKWQLIKQKQLMQWQLAKPIRSLACGDAYADALPTTASENAHVHQPQATQFPPAHTCAERQNGHRARAAAAVRIALRKRGIERH